MLDIESGAQEAFDDAEVGWCEGPLMNDSIKGTDGVTRDYISAVQAFPCTLNGEAEPPVGRIPDWAGVNVGDLAVWIEGDTVRAEQRREE